MSMSSSQTPAAGAKVLRWVRQGTPRNEASAEAGRALQSRDEGMRVGEVSGRAGAAGSDDVSGLSAMSVDMQNWWEFLGGGLTTKFALGS